MGKTVSGSDMPCPSHHPDEGLVMDYATGAACEAGSLILASHMTLCPRCRSLAETCDVVGGSLLAEIEPEPVSKRCLLAVLAGIGDRRGAAPDPARPRPPADIVLPAPLRNHLGTDLNGVAWRRVMPGIEEAHVPTCGGRFKGRLMRIAAGVAVPRHTHDGVEMTLVLAGGFSDEHGRYVRGDLSVSGPEIDHAPVVDADGECVCFVATDGPMKLTGPVARLFSRFIRF